MHFPHQNNTLATTNEAPAQGIKMEVGIEDCLHIEFEFDKQKYHLKVLSAQPAVVSALSLVTSLVAIHRPVCSLLLNTIGRNSGQDLFPAGPHQDQVHGAGGHPPRGCR
jgi:hypothetical protein